MRLELFSKYRTHIMGAAMIWIMFFHTPFSAKTEMGNFLHIIGFYGVDMFLLVSGLGLYYSMRKSKGILDFYRKRAVRILPAYLIVTICWYAFFKTDLTFGDTLLSILGINYFRGTIYGRPPYFDWFLPTLFALYLLTPLYDKLFQRVQAKWKLTALMSMISPALCLWAHFTNRQVLYGSFVRVPVFLVGYCIGWFLYEKKEEQKGSWMVHIALLTGGLLLGYCVQNELKPVAGIFWGINAYPALIAAPGICALIGLLCKYFEKWLKIVGRILLLPLYICGRYSLEIYLFHQRLMEYMNSETCAEVRNAVIGGLGYDRYTLLLAIASIALAAALHELIAPAVKGISSIGKKKT